MSTSLRRAVRSLIITIITLASGAAAIVLADFGRSFWMFALLLVGPLTIGLPTTLTMLLIACVWGKLPWLHGLGTFVICVTLCAVPVQTLSDHCVSRMIRLRLQNNRFA